MTCAARTPVKVHFGARGMDRTGACFRMAVPGHKAQFEAALAEGREALEAITALAAEIRGQGNQNDASASSLFGISPGKPLPAARLKALEDLTEDGSATGLRHFFGSLKGLSRTMLPEVMVHGRQFAQCQSQTAGPQGLFAGKKKARGVERRAGSGGFTRPSRAIARVPWPRSSRVPRRLCQIRTGSSKRRRRPAGGGRCRIPQPKLSAQPGGVAL